MSIDWFRLTRLINIKLVNQVTTWFDCSNFGSTFMRSLLEEPTDG